MVVFVFSVLLSGCDQPKRASPCQTTATDPSQAAPPSGNYVMTTSSVDGTFMFDSHVGKVWRYSAKDDAFIEVPVTSKILRYERGPDGKMRIVHPDNDPLGIR